MISLSAALLLAALPPAKAAAAQAGDLAPPVVIAAGGKPIDVEVGHAAPCVADFKGDGTLCLLVGQFGEGKLRIYANTGSKRKPRFGKFDWFMAGGKLGTVPAS
jgi:hypothetical protein